MVKIFEGIKQAATGFWDLISGNKARRSRERRAQLEQSLAKAASKNVTAREAHQQLQGRRHWTDMNRKEIMGEGAAALLGGLAGGGSLKSVARPNESFAALGRGIGEFGDFVVSQGPRKLDTGLNVGLAFMQGRGKQAVGRLAMDAAQRYLQPRAEKAFGDLAGRALPSLAAGARLPSAAKGGISARKQVVRVHKGEKIVAKKAVGPLIKLMKKRGVGLPLNRIRAIRKDGGR